MVISKIDFIRIFRSVTRMGLADSKYAVEAFLSAFDMDAPMNTNSVETINSFAKFIGLFTNKEVYMNDKFQILPSQVIPLSKQDIYRMSGGESQ